MRAFRQRREVLRVNGGRVKRMHPRRRLLTVTAAVAHSVRAVGERVPAAMTLVALNLLARSRVARRPRAGHLPQRTCRDQARRRRLATCATSGGPATAATSPKPPWPNSPAPPRYWSHRRDRQWRIDAEDQPQTHHAEGHSRPAWRCPVPDPGHSDNMVATRLPGSSYSATVMCERRH